MIMRNTKRYTNQTFTKHVDDEKGRHRTLRSLPEPAVCEVCADVYADRRWSKPDAERQSAKHEHFRAANRVVCPACKRQRTGVPSGYVYVQGSFLAAHRDGPGMHQMPWPPPHSSPSPSSAGSLA